MTARQKIAAALSGGGALTAYELSIEAGVPRQAVGAQLKKLLAADLVAVEVQGRHRYFRLAEDQAAAGRRPRRVRTGPKDPVLRKARSCYGHLAGDLGVALYDGLARHGRIRVVGDKLDLTEPGREFFRGIGIDLDGIEGARRPTCRRCLDWSVRRSHLAGGLGLALLAQFCELGWARRPAGSRLVQFSTAGERAFRSRFGLDA